MVVEIENNLGTVTNELYVDEVTNEIYPASYCNANEDHRVLWCTNLASISRGKFISANPQARFNLLKKEAAPLENDNSNTKTPSRPLEFIGVVLTGILKNPREIDILTQHVTGFNNRHNFTLVDFINKIGRFSYMEYVERDVVKIYTNMRAVLNAGIPYNEVPYNTPEECKSFKAVRVTCPMFVFNHLVTHTALSKEARSERVVDIGQIDYWYPQNILPDEFMNLFQNKSQVEVWNYLQEKGYSKEIYQRAILEWRFKTFVLCAWDNEYTWQHLFLERGAREDRYTNWTQEETKKVVKAIKKVIESE